MNPTINKLNQTCMIVLIVLSGLSNCLQAKDNPKIVPAIQDKLSASLSQVSEGNHWSLEQ